MGRYTSRLRLEEKRNKLASLLALLKEREEKALLECYQLERVYSDSKTKRGELSKLGSKVNKLERKVTSLDKKIDSLQWYAPQPRIEKKHVGVTLLVMFIVLGGIIMLTDLGDVRSNVAELTGFAVGAADVKIAAGEGEWWNTNWDKCKNITITNSNETTLTDFPAFINVTYNESMQPDWDDIRFVNTSCGNTDSELDYEFVENDSLAGEFWVKIPSLPAGDTIISMYYNNSGASSGENPTGVWSNNYVAVYHMLDNDTSSINDSTSNVNYGAKLDSEHPNETTGKIYNAQDFNGTADYVDCGNDSSFDVDLITLEAWVKPDAIGTGFQAIIGKWQDAEPPSKLFFGAHGFTDWLQWEIDIGDVHEILSIDNFFFADEWVYVVGRYNGSHISIYRNGAQFGAINAASGDINKSVVNLLIGGYDVPPKGFFNGTMDEIRVINTSRSADWINMSYQIIENQGSFVAWGIEEEQPSGNNAPSQVTLDSPANDTPTTNLTPTFNWDNATDADSDTLTYQILVDDDIGFGSPVINESSIAEDMDPTNYTPTNDLAVDTTYYWKVRANDSTEYGEWSETWQIDVQSSTVISLPTSNVTFGTMYPGDSNDTTDAYIHPLTVSNDGNVHLNISINATDIWSVAIGLIPSDYYNFKVSVNESDAYNSATETWTQMPASATEMIEKLKFENTTITANRANIDINITVPAKEAGIFRASIVVISAELAT